MILIYGLFATRAHKLLRQNILVKAEYISQKKWSG